MLGEFYSPYKIYLRENESKSRIMQYTNIFYIICLQ